MNQTNAEVSKRSSNGEPPQQFISTERPQINLDFIDVYYPARNSGKISGKKQILKGVSGSFKFGELSVILGSSGAGKSTLLNILTGYVSFGVAGFIKINGYPCKMNTFRKLSSYIMQDDIIQSYLTLEESMMIAANLKLGKGVSEDNKLKVVNEILNTLGLENHKDTRTEKLSGGQKKRLSIALEMISDPPVIFLDEPTTGLDSVSTLHVIRLLHQLARQGRTVICTVHQPSALICQYFDHMYIMTRGCCVYQGSYQTLVPFMAEVGYECPTTHNPSDYIIEVIQDKAKNDYHKFSEAVENGKLSAEPSGRADNGGLIKIVRGQKVSKRLDCILHDGLQHPSRFSHQFSVLLKRRLKQQSRNLLSIGILLFHHLLNGFLLGKTFEGVGSDAGRFFDNFKFLICIVVFFMYTNIMGPVLLFPMELKIMKREYFNRWYGLKAYFAALSVASLPYQLVFGAIFILLTYTISSQPLETNRLLLFLLIGLLLGYTSEGWGLTIGSLFSTRNGSIVGPASIVPLLAVSMYGIGYGTAIQPVMSFLMSLSYLRYGVTGLATVVYGRNRTLFCDLDKYDYCHYKDPKLLLKDLGMEGDTVQGQIMGIVFFLFFYRVTAFFGMRFRLSFDFSNKILTFANKMVKYGRKQSE